MTIVVGGGTAGQERSRNALTVLSMMSLAGVRILMKLLFILPHFD